MTKLHYSYLYLYGTLPIILALSFHYLTLNAFCFGLLIQNVLVCYCKCWIHSILVDCYIRILVCTYRIFIKKILRIFEKIASRTQRHGHAPCKGIYGGVSLQSQVHPQSHLIGTVSVEDTRYGAPQKEKMLRAHTEIRPHLGTSRK